MWLLSALLLFWTGHMWLMAHRGHIHDDPVAFALRDPRQPRLRFVDGRRLAAGAMKHSRCHAIRLHACAGLSLLLMALPAGQGQSAMPPVRDAIVELQAARVSRKRAPARRRRAQRGSATLAT